MSNSSLIAPAIDHFKAQKPKRTASLVVSFFGDAITLRGGTVWLGTLREFMEPLEVDSNALRVSMHRLTKDGWLASSKDGRNAYYSLTEKGDQVFRGAAERIYGQPGTADTDEIETAIILNTDNRAALRQTYQDQGWGTLAPNILVRPHRDGIASVDNENAVHLVSRPDAETLRRIVWTVWPLDALEQQIAAFETLFQPIRAALGAGTDLKPGEAMLLRVLLIHEYRRIVLKTPVLPKGFFPKTWRGADIRAIAAEIYARILPASETWLDCHGTTPNGPLPVADRELQERLK